MKFNRPKTLQIVMALVFLAIAVRVVAALLPVPLNAERRMVRLYLFVQASPNGLADVLPVDETIRHARSGVLFGRIISVQSRPAVVPSSKPGWASSRDLLIELSAGARFQAGKGLYLGRNLAVRVGETHLFRTTFGVFWGRVERISLNSRD